MTALTALRPMERVARNAALGLRFHDVATGDTAIDGLHVEVFHAANRHVRAMARPGPGGVYTAARVPGLSAFEFEDAEPPQSLWPAATRPYRVEVSDPQGRYLSIAFDADLPSRGLSGWPGIVSSPWLSPPPLFAMPLASNASPSWVAHIPLFSAPSRPVPEPLGVVHAQLADQASGRPLPRALLGVSIAGVPCGLGLADERGCVMVPFPYPEPPRRVLASPVVAQDDFAWDVVLTAFGDTPPPAAVVPPFADLARVGDAMALPRQVMLSLGSPPHALRLTYRQPLVARTAGALGALASHLLVA